MKGLYPAQEDPPTSAPPPAGDWYQALTHAQLPFPTDAPQQRAFIPAEQAPPTIAPPPADTHVSSPATSSPSAADTNASPPAASGSDSPASPEP